MAQVTNPDPTSLHRLSLVVALVALLSMLLNEPTVWFADNRYEQYAEPLQRLGHMFTLWDGTRGLGAPNSEFWIGNTVPIAVVREAGVPIGVTLHLWHAALITLAAVGAAAFLRCLRPNVGIEHWVTAALYGFGPYSAGFLSPSNLYMGYAAAPWIFLCFYRGISGVHRWRWPAALALIMLALGLVDLPTQLFTAVYLVPLAFYCVHVERGTTWRRVSGWCARSALLTLGVMAAPLYAAFVSSEFFSQRLHETENPLGLWQNASWSESWRGMGGWLLYFPVGTETARPQAAVYLSQPVAILASFLAPIGAVVAMGFVKAKERALLGSFVLVGLVLMTALYQPGDRSLYGSMLAWLFDTYPASWVLRSSYKAGSGMVLGTAALAGLLLATAWSAARARWAQTNGLATRLLAAALGLALFAAIAQPFWLTGLYDNERLETVPNYVTEAMASIDMLPGDGRVLFLPGVNRGEFRWGHVNDDVLDALLNRPYVTDVPVHRSGRVAADSLHHMTTNLVDARYTDGAVSLYADYLGADYIVLRNDFLWGRSGQPRPAAFDRLRNDPALELVATFGDPGENTAAESDNSLSAQRERELPPIEVYALRQPGSLLAVEPSRQPLVVSGDGAVWPLLANLGLDRSADVRFSGALETETLAEIVGEGAPVLITDTNVRTLETIARQARESYPLASGASLDRMTIELFDKPYSQTTAYFGPGVSIGQAGNSDPAGTLAPNHRPAFAFDGEDNTSWRSSSVKPHGEGVEIKWADGLGFTSLRVVVEESEQVVPVKSVRVTTDAGESLVVAVDNGVADVDLGFGVRYWLRVQAEVAASATGPVGISEIVIDGERGQFAEVLAMPSDVYRSLHQHDSGAVPGPVGYVFSAPTEPATTTTSMRRGFHALKDDKLHLTGELRVTPAVSEELLAELAQTDPVATASSRLRNDPSYAGYRAVDGDSSTAWLFDAPSAVLKLSLAETTVEDISVDVRVGGGFAVPSVLFVDIAGQEVSLTAQSHECPEPDQCVMTYVGAPELNASQLDLVIERSPGVDPVRVDEVRINGVPNQRSLAHASCSESVVQLDEDKVAVALVNPTELGSVDRLAFRSCGQVDIKAGHHRLVVSSGLDVRSASLLPDALDIGVSNRFEGDLASEEISRAEATAVLNAPNGSRVVWRQSFHPGWVARLDGKRLEEAQDVAGVVTWELPRGSSNGSLDISFEPQQGFRWAIALTAVTALGCMCAAFVGAWGGRRDG